MQFSAVTVLLVHALLGAAATVLATATSVAGAVDPPSVRQPLLKSDSNSDQLSDRCVSCSRREEAKARNIRAIKDGILKKLGFDQPVNLTGKVLPPVPKHLLAKWEEDYRQFQNDQMEVDSGYEEDDDFHVRTEQIVTFAQSYPHVRHFKSRNVLYFNLSSSITKFRVANASLYIFVKGTARKIQPIITLEVFKLYKQDVDSSVKIAAKKIVQPQGPGDFFKLDATVMISEWFKNPEENFGFFVDLIIEGKKSSLDVEHNKNMPYAEIFTSEPKRRIRRQNLNCEERSPESICCRYPLQIDFETFGWNFIIAPKRYDAYYCSGECSYLTLQKNPHTHLATMAAPHVATPCCAPRKLSPITMLYFDENSNVVYGSLPGMVVDRCGCS
nr:growth/differentiation factor 8 [Onthophagus taurus]